MPQHSLIAIVGGEARRDLKCTSCQLGIHPDLRTNCMSGVGVQNPDFMFVGMAPGKHENKTGRPMTGPNGQLFWELLFEAGIAESQCYVTNCLKCCPFGEKLKPGYFQRCKGHLQQEVALVKPRCIVAVGGVSLEWLTGYRGIRKLRRRGIPYTENHGINVFPIQQPISLEYAAPGRQVSIRKQMVEDLQWLNARAKTGKLSQADEFDVDYRLASTLDDVEAFFDELDQYPELACDFETTSLFPEPGDVIIAVGFSARPGHARVFPLYAWGPTSLHYWTEEELDFVVIPKIRRLLETKGIFGQNFVQFDQKWMRFLLELDKADIVFDTMYAHYLIDEDSEHALEAMAIRYTSIPPWKKTFNPKDIQKLAYYLSLDVDACSRLRPIFEKQLTEKQTWLLHNLLIPLGHEFNDMEYVGVSVDLEALSALAATLTTKLQEEISQLRAMPEVQAFELDKNTTINVDSPAHLRDIMENYLRLPCIRRTANGHYSTGADVLEELKDNLFVGHVQRIRKLSKLKGTYCLGMINRIKKHSGRIHTHYLIHGTVTGRPSSQDPNLMNIPREETAGVVLEDGNAVKAIFSASEGCVFVYADIGQAELRVLAMYSRDPTLVQIFQRGEDVHTSTAADVYGVPLDQVTKPQRFGAKKVNFGIIYGRTLMTIADQFEEAGQSRGDAEHFWNRHHVRFPVVWSWLAAQVQQIETYGCQETFFGRRRHYPEYITEHNRRQAMNFLIQSVANDLTLVSLVRISKILRERGIPARPVLTVYDSIAFDTSLEYAWEVAKIIKQVMENLNFSFMNVPLVVDIEMGFTWGTLKKVDVENQAVLIS